MKLDWKSCRYSLCAWSLQLIAAILPALAGGVPIIAASHAGGAFFLTILLTLYVTVLFPQIGSWRETRGAIHLIVFFVSVFLILAQILATPNETITGILLEEVTSGIETTLSPLLGQELAALCAHPFHLILAGLVTLSLAWGSPVPILCAVLALLLYGLFPFRWEMLGAYLLWFAGYSLMLRQSESPSPMLPLRILPAQFSRREIERVPNDRTQEYGEIDDGDENDWESNILDRDFSAKRNNFEHSDPEEDYAPDYGNERRRDDRMLPRTDSWNDVTRVPQWNDYGFRPSGCTGNETDTPHFDVQTTLLHVLQYTACGFILAAAAVYLLLPVDLFPESLLGPVGIIDDVVVCLLASLPAGKMLLTVIGKHMPLHH